MKIEALGLIQKHAFIMSQQLTMQSSASVESAVLFDDRLWDILDFKREGEELAGEAFRARATKVGTLSLHLNVKGGQGALLRGTLGACLEEGTPSLS